MASTLHAIARTKITTPEPRRQLIARTRLLDRINSFGGGSTIFICAPAGYGKSALAAGWAAETSKPCAWFAVDDTDNDANRFWRYAAAAFSTIMPEESQSRLIALIQSLKGLSMTSFLDGLINELSELPETGAFVLDDYHYIHNPDIHSGLSYFISYLPDTVQLIVTSREALPFSAAKWKLHGRSDLIDMKELQFTREEAGLLVEQFALPSLTERHIGELLQRTEGWATGLQLAIHSIQSGHSAEHWLEQFAGDHRDVAEYLFHEVLDGLSDELLRFLLHTSVVTRMNAELCNALTDSDAGTDMLALLQRSNMFLMPLDERNGWFRYHHLFAELLSDLLKRQNEEQWRALHLKASEWFAERGWMETAVEHVIQAERFDLAETYMERELRSLLVRGELGTLLRWFESFPAAYALSVNMILMHSFIYVLTGQLMRAEQLLQGLEGRCRTMPPGKQADDLLSGVMFVRSNLVFASGDFVKWFSFANESLGRIVTPNEWFYSFNYNVREPLVRRTSLGLKGVLSDDTSKVGAMFTGVLDAHGWQDSLINLYVKQSLAEGYYEWNRLEECEHWLRSIEHAVMSRALPGLVIPHRLTEARKHAALGAMRLAYDAAEEAQSFARQAAEPIWSSVASAFKVRLLLQEGELAQAKREAAGLRISGKDKPFFDREYEYFAWIRLLGAQRKEKEALRLLELLKPQAQREGMVSSLAEIAMLESLLHEAAMNRNAAFASLREALHIGGSNGYVRLFADEGAAMAGLLKAYKTELAKLPVQTDDQQNGLSYVERLLEAFPAPLSPEQDRRAPELAEELNRSERELLRQLQKGATNKQMAAAMALSEGTVKVYLSNLYGKLGVSSRTQALIAAQRLGLLG